MNRASFKKLGSPGLGDSSNRAYVGAWSLHGPTPSQRMLTPPTAGTWVTARPTIPSCALPVLRSVPQPPTLKSDCL